MLRQVCHLMRASILERVRRPGFLLAAGILTAISYFSWSWTTPALSLLGFFLVRDALAQDERTGVGQILAATPTQSGTYLLGKLGGSLLLLSLLAAFALAGGLLSGIASGMPDRWAVVAPRLITTLPLLVMIAATALLFETLPWLRDAFGSALYLVLWLAAMALRVPADQAAARAASPSILLHLLWLAAALVVWLAGNRAFRRFESIRPRFRRRSLPAEPEIPDQNAAPAVPQIQMTPVVRGGLMSDAFDAVLSAEWRLLVRDQPLWWYAGAVLLMVAPLLAPLSLVREVLWPVAWLWPALRWAELGTREVRRRTAELVLTSSRPVGRQMPAAWLAGVLLAMAAGSGVLVRLVYEQSPTAILAWVVGALFTPALALALGVWTGSTQPFAWLYTLWLLGGMLTRVASLDFLGIQAEVRSPMIPLAYLALTIALLGMAVLGRSGRGRT